jgi:hypothetical protein
MRTFGFVIFFFPVYYQDGSGDALRSHLRPSSFRRMPLLKTFNARTRCNASASGARAALNQKKPPKMRQRPAARNFGCEQEWTAPGARV